MIALISRYKIKAFQTDERAENLANTYLRAGVIPERFRTDCLHIAIASVNAMDCIISLNFHHINKLKTKMTTEIIHRMKGLNNPFICTPMEVI